MTKQEQIEQYVNRETTIGDVVGKYPQAAQILTDKGLHCVGCSVQYWESIENGFRGHGMPDEMIDETIDELNIFISELKKKEAERGDTPLSITEKAASKLKELIKEEKDMDIKGVRVHVVSGGCAGMTYAMDFEKDIGLDDEVIEDKGLKLIMDPESLKLLYGTEITYIDSLNGSGFKFQNPKAKSGCGCGKSFN